MTQSVLEYRTRPALLHELLQLRTTSSTITTTTANNNNNNSSSHISSANDSSTGIVTTVSPLTSAPVLASGASSAESFDEPELAQQAAAIATATTTAATEAAVQDRPLAIAVPIPPVMNGKSRSWASADVAATSEDALSDSLVKKYFLVQNLMMMVVMKIHQLQEEERSVNPEVQSLLALVTSLLWLV
jgi:hypothetical protein